MASGFFSIASRYSGNLSHSYVLPSESAVPGMPPTPPIMPISHRRARDPPGQNPAPFTDAITEAVSPDDEMFRIEGIEKALITCNGEPSCVILEVVDALKEHEAGVRARDDQTIVALQLTGD